MAIRLARFAERHLPDVPALVEDPDVVRYTRIPEPPPPDFPARWVARYEEGRAAGTAEAFAIEDAETGTFLGLALAPRIDREAETAELGYVVVRAARGRGVATEALRLLTEWGFSELGAQRLELLISVENDASKRVAERCGYVREGVLRSLAFKGDRRDDMEIWSRLPTDP